jgi:hypothetical protein
MTETNEYVSNAIKHWVWSGFYGADEVQDMIGDILEQDADEAMLRNSVGREFAAKAAAEASWPDETDCDRLDRAFAALDASGIIALANAGYTMSDGLDEVNEALHAKPPVKARGYCFYHAQDVERAIDGDGLMIAFGDLNNDKDRKVEIGKIVHQALEREGLNVTWNGDSETRLGIPQFDWKRRSADLVPKPAISNDSTRASLPQRALRWFIRRR